MKRLVFLSTLFLTTSLMASEFDCTKVPIKKFRIAAAIEQKQKATIAYYAPILKAIENNDFQKFCIHLDSPEIDINFNDAENTFLGTAIVWVRNKMVKELLKRGAEVNKPNKASFTPLGNAALCDNLKAAKILLKNGAQINQSTLFLASTALHFATGQKHIKMVKLLLSHGANTSLINNFNESALDIAKKNLSKANDGKEKYKDNVIARYQNIIDLFKPETIAQLKKDREDTIRKKSLLKIEQLRLIQSITKKSPSIDIHFILLLKRI